MTLNLVPMPQRDVDHEAAEWFARSRSGQMTDAELDAIEAWFNSAPGNREAFDEVAAAWDEVEYVRRDPAVLLLREKAKQAVRRGRAATVLRQAAAVIFAVGAVFMLARLTTWAFGTDAETYSTRLGQTSNIVLADGSKVTLDTNTELKVSMRNSGERRLELVRGRAFFRVAKNKDRPFVVRTEGGSVTAVGTEFDVRKDAGSLQVTLVEGRVRIKPLIANRDAAPVEMVAGYQYASSQHGYRVTKAENNFETSWIEGDLVFDEEPLSVIVAEMNRYTAEKIVIVDPEVAERRLSAVLKIGDTETFLSAVQMMRFATVSRTRTSGILLLDPAKIAAK